MPSGRSKELIPKPIIVECHTEDVLAKAVGFSGRLVNHQAPAGRDRVLTRLQRWSSDTPAVGLIDQDHKTNPVLDEYSVTADETDFRLRVARHNTFSGVWYIMVLPDFENWFLWNCRQLQIDVQSYNLPSNPRDWRDLKAIGLGGAKYLNGFNSLVKDLLAQESSFISVYKSHIVSILD